MRKLMRHTWQKVLLGGTLALCALPVCAAPQNGLGLFVGPALEMIRLRQPTQDYNFAGLGIGADEQFVISNDWSVNPSLQVEYGKASGDINNHIVNAQGIIEFRRWFGDRFIGAETGYDYEFRMPYGVVYARNSPGVGLLGGWEDPGGAMITLQLDAPQSLSLALPGLRLAAWLQFGYRWH